MAGSAPLISGGKEERFGYVLTVAEVGALRKGAAAFDSEREAHGERPSPPPK